MKPPTAADRHTALIRAERNALRDWNDARFTWGSSDPSTVARRETLESIRDRLATDPVR